MDDKGATDCIQHIDRLASVGRKIVINGRFLLQDITGVQRVEREILVALDNIFSDCIHEPPVILVPKKGQLVQPLHLNNIKLKQVGRLSGHLWEQLELPIYCKNRILWCLGNTAPIWSLMSSDTFTVTMVHDLSYKYFPSAYSWQFKALYSLVVPLALKLSDQVVTVSESEKDSILTHYPSLKMKSNIHAFQNGGIPDERLKKIIYEELPTLDERKYGIYVGSLSKRKNAAGTIRGAISFLQSYKDLEFYVVGASSEVFEVFNIEIPDEVKSRIKFLGQINDPDKIYSLLKSAKFLLFPSFYEASPMPPVEAMSFGTPVISSNIPSLMERCKDAAIYTKSHSHEDIMSAIGQLMNSDALWESTSKKGFQIANEYSWHLQASNLLSISR